MEREGNAAAGAAGEGGRWEASADGVIVLPAGSAVPRPAHQHQREKEERQPAGKAKAKAKPAGAGLLGEVPAPEPPEKVFYKTKLCEKFEAGGRCAYEDGCTFAHGHAELRPPLPMPASAAARRSKPAPAAADLDAGGRSGFHFGFGKVCFEFRDKGTCHFGDRCNFAHGSAPPPAAAAEIRYPKLGEPARRSATPPARGFSPVGGSGGYAPAAARAFSPAPAAADQDGRKPTRLELLSRKKMNGIYGDWPEES